MKDKDEILKHIGRDKLKLVVEYIETRLTERRNTLEGSNGLENMARIQGRCIELKKIKEEVNFLLTSK